MLAYYYETLVCETYVIEFIDPNLIVVIEGNILNLQNNTKNSNKKEQI